MNNEAARVAESAASFRRALPALLLLASVFLLNFISRVIFSPLLPKIQQDMGLDHAVAGSLFLVMSSGYFLSILFSGSVSSRLGHKRTIVASTVGAGLMLILIGFCPTIDSVRIGLFCLGYAAGLYLQSGLATISRLVSLPYMARGVAVHELAPNLGFVTAPLICELILHYFSWREGLQLLGMVLCGMGFFYAIRAGGNPQPGRKMDFSLVRRLLVLPEFWVMVLLFSFAICSTLGIYAMLPLYLVTEKGMDMETANRLVSLSRVSSVVMPLAGGWIGDRFGNGRIMLGVLLVAGLFTIPLGMQSSSWLTTLVVLQAMVAVCFFPSGFAVLSQIGGGKAEGSAVSLCIPLAFLVGGGVMPLAIGSVGDYYSLAAGFVGAGCGIVLVALVGFGLSRKLALFRSGC